MTFCYTRKVHGQQDRRQTCVCIVALALFVHFMREHYAEAERGSMVQIVLFCSRSFSMLGILRWQPCDQHHFQERFRNWSEYASSCLPGCLPGCLLSRNESQNNLVRLAEYELDCVLLQPTLLLHQATTRNCILTEQQQKSARSKSASLRCTPPYLLFVRHFSKAKKK